MYKRQNLLLNIRAKYCFLRANGIYYNCQQKVVDRMAGNTTNISIRMDADLKAQDVYKRQVMDGRTRSGLPGAGFSS